IQKIVLFLLEQQGLLASRLDALGKRNHVLQKYVLYEKLIETLGDLGTGVSDAFWDDECGEINSWKIRRIDQSVNVKLRDQNAKESWALLEDLTLYDNESWNNPGDFAKPVKAIALPQDVPITSDRRLIELKNQVQRLMEAYLAPT
ncbi:hypothetical protein Tco_0542962, partial [Tanacetum coccineum]